MNTCLIYLITNKINNRIYIGQTWRPLLKRFKKHCEKNSCVKLYRAIKKYGKDNFKIECIAACSSQDVADYLEISYINEYDSIINGYNLRHGGSRGKVSEETIKRMCIAQKGRKHSIETKLKISNSKKGCAAPNKGKSMSLAAKLNISISQIGNKYRLGKFKLSEEQKKEIILSKLSSRKLAPLYNVSRCTIVNIRKGK